MTEVVQAWIDATVFHVSVAIACLALAIVCLVLVAVVGMMDEPPEDHL